MVVIQQAEAELSAFVIGKKTAKTARPAGYFSFWKEWSERYKPLSGRSVDQDGESTARREGITLSMQVNVVDALRL